MNDIPPDLMRISQLPVLDHGTLVLAFSGWMDGGDVSTGTVERLIELTGAEQFAEIDPEPFFIYNFPGSMEVAALFRPHVDIKDGLVKTIRMPSNRFFCHPQGNLVLFVGKEPNMHWQLFGDSIFQLARSAGIARIVFVGSYGGSVPHTREPRLYVTCSDPQMLPEMQQYGVRRTEYQGPGSFTNYLMSRAPSAAVEMVSLVAEIPSYLQGRNPASIAAVTRRLAKILNLRVELDSLRAASTRWELEVTSAVEEDEELTEEVRRLEASYDEELLELDQDDE